MNKVVRRDLDGMVQRSCETRLDTCAWDDWIDLESPVGIDAQFMHAIIIAFLQQISNRVDAIESQLRSMQSSEVMRNGGMFMDNWSSHQIVPGIAVTSSGQATVDPSLADVLFDLAVNFEEPTNLPVTGDAVCQYAPMFGN